MRFLQERRKARPVNRMPIRLRWYVPIAVLCAPMPVLLPMYGTGDPFRGVLIVCHLLGMVSSIVWLRSARRRWPRIGVGVLFAWYLLPAVRFAAGAIGA